MGSRHSQTRPSCSSSVARQCTASYCPADTSLAAWEILLGHLRPSSVQSGPGIVWLFSVSENEGTYCLQALHKMMNTLPEEYCWRPHGMTRVYTNCFQVTSSALMSEATMWNSRQRYVTKLFPYYWSDNVFRPVEYSKSPVVNLAERHETLFVNKIVAVCKSVEANVI